MLYAGNDSLAIVRRVRTGIKVIYAVCFTTFLFNVLRSTQNGRLFPDDIFQCIFFNENVWLSVNISVKFIPKGPINNIQALVQIMAWRRPGDKPLSEPMIDSLLTHKCVTRLQWVNAECAKWYMSQWHESIISEVAAIKWKLKWQWQTFASVAIGRYSHLNGNIGAMRQEKSFLGRDYFVWHNKLNLVGPCGDSYCRNGYSHVKRSDGRETFLSLSWGSLYWQSDIFIEIG